MAVDSDLIVGLCVFVAIGMVCFYVGYQAGQWQNDGDNSGDGSTQSKSPAEAVSASLQETQPNTQKSSPEDGGAANLHTIYKKGQDEAAGQAEELPPKRSPDTLQNRDKVKDKMRDATVDAIVARLVEKLEKGEIRLRACGGGGEEGECQNVTKVTHVTRLEYQCLLQDKVRWGLLENDLKKAMAEEMDLKIARAGEETQTVLKLLNRTLERRLDEVVADITKHLEVKARSAAEAQEQQMAEMDQRLKEMDNRLTLEPQILEIKGFMKIDTFGPALLLMGALQVLMLLCAGFLFMRVR